VLRLLNLLVEFGRLRTSQLESQALCKIKHTLSPLSVRLLTEDREPVFRFLLPPFKIVVSRRSLPSSLRKEAANNLVDSGDNATRGEQSTGGGFGATIG
jgi:hypothetical protein